jgi:alkanesulfonate monooxygenase SsuD/methylene tetrahydromethanopterin reductase-like flavin-dependent oxidoreductase (luciferase family)
MANEVPSTPGAVQQPLPLTIATGGRKGMQLVVAYGRNWVTIGPTGAVERTPELVLETVRRQLGLLHEVCASAGRQPGSVGKVLLWMPTDPVITSADQFDELAGPYEALGFDQFVLHHPAQTGPFGGDVGAFEAIAARHATA